MANVVNAKKANLVGMWSGIQSGSIDKIGIYGSVEEGAVQIIDEIKSITWADATTMTADVVFTIPADTRVFGVVLFNSSDLDTPETYNYSTDPYFDYNFVAMGQTAYTYTNQGLLTITSMTLGVQ